MDTIGKRLIWMREIAGLSGSELARLAGISRAYPSSIEHGRSGERIGMEYALKIARVFGVTPEWLVLGTGVVPGKVTIRRAVARARAKQAA